MNGKYLFRMILLLVIPAFTAGCSDNNDGRAELSFSIQLSKGYTDTVTLSEMYLNTLETIPIFSGDRALSYDPVEIGTQVEPTVMDSINLALFLLVNGVSKTLSGTYPSDTITEWTSGNQYLYYVTVNEDSLAFGAVQKSEWTSRDTLDLNIQ